MKVFLLGQNTIIVIVTLLIVFGLMFTIKTQVGLLLKIQPLKLYVFLLLEFIKTPLILVVKKEGLGVIL